MVCRQLGLLSMYCPPSEDGLAGVTGQGGTGKLQVAFEGHPGDLDKADSWGGLLATLFSLRTWKHPKCLNSMGLARKIMKLPHNKYSAAII